LAHLRFLPRFEKDIQFLSEAWKLARP
jgi:hypothetical protein